MKEKPSILVVGSINMDLVLKISRVPQGGESSIGESYQYIPGGKGGNQAVAAARLGADVTFAGKVGADGNGAVLAETLTREGIATEFLDVSQDVQSGLAVILLEDSGQNRILVYPGANMEIQLEDVQRAFAKSYDAVMLQLEIPERIVLETCRLAKERGIPVILDAGPAQDFPLEKTMGIEILSPNETETLALTGIDVHTPEEAERAARILQERSKAPYIVLKMGEHGAYLYCDGKLEHFKGCKVKAIDTTAAGDAFTAGMVESFIRCGDIREAIRYANGVGALTVTRLGAQPSLPTAREVQEFIDSQILP